MEKTATHDADYVDVVVGYHHVLLLGLLFGVLMFSTGYFLGSSGTPGATSERGDRRVSAATLPTPSPQPNGLPAAAPTVPMRHESGAGMPATRTATPKSGALPPAVQGNARPAAASSPPPQKPRSAKSAARAVVAPTDEHPPRTVNNLSLAAVRAEAAPGEADSKRRGGSARNTEHYFGDDAYQRYKDPQTRESFKIYLRISSIREQQKAENLIQDLAAEGIRAVVEGQSVEGRYMVLIGPLADYASAASLSQKLKQRDLDAFPIRR